MSEKQIAKALIGESGEIDTNVWGLPVFRVYATQKSSCILVEDKGEIESAIGESIKYVDKSKRTFVLLLVEIIPMSQRKRKSRPTGGRRRRTEGGRG